METIIWLWKIPPILVRWQGLVSYLVMGSLQPAKRAKRKHITCVSAVVAKENAFQLRNLPLSEVVAIILGSKAVSLCG